MNNLHNYLSMIKLVIEGQYGKIKGIIRRRSFKLKERGLVIINLMLKLNQLDKLLQVISLHCLIF